MSREFRLGVAMSSLGAEGAALASDWFAWEREDRAPPSWDGAGFAVDFADDLRLFAGLGASVVRFGIDWSRIEPAEGTVDLAAAERYREVLVAARDAGVEPWVTLVDRTLPGWFTYDERGWRDRRARSYFWPRHVERCAELFGDLACGWVPIARAVASARAGFLVGSAPPGVTSGLRYAETVLGASLAALEAWRVLRGGGAPVAACHEAAPVRPADDLVPTRQAARAVEGAVWGWTEAYRDGVVRVAGLAPVQAPAYRDAFDVVGITFEGELVVGGDGTVTARARPEDLTATLARMAEEGPDRPLAVLGHLTARGDAPEADAERLAAAFDEIDAALRDGIPLELWLYEPAMDGYEVPGGFGRRLGLFDRDRVPRPAAALFAERAGGVSAGPTT